jgi:tight adherence protein C
MEALLLAAFFMVVLAGVTAAGYFFLIKPDTESTAIVPIAMAGAGESEPLSARDMVANTLQSIGEALPSAHTGGNTLRRKLMCAGFWTPQAVSIFNGITYATAVLLALIAASIVLIFRESPSDAIVPAFCAAGFGYLLPKRLLESRITARARRVTSGLPTALDLLVLSVEAGQALDQSLYDASREIRKAFPDLADELGQVSMSLRASATRSEVFRDFADRNQDQEIRKMANVLIDSDRFGTSLGPTLRTHARYLRIRRRHGAQERARKVGVKLVFPIFFLIFPSVLLVTLGPAVLQIMTTLRPMLEGR